MGLLKCLYKTTKLRMTFTRIPCAFTIKPFPEAAFLRVCLDDNFGLVFQKEIVYLGCQLQEVHFHGCKKSRQVFVCLNKVFTDADCRLVEFVMRLLYFFEQRCKAGHQVFSPFPPLPIEPLAKTALVGICLNIKLCNIVVGQKGIDLVYPVEMIQLFLGQIPV